MKIKQQPLYVQVKTELVKKIAQKIWQAGDPIPNEAMLAKEFGVSQGTVRRALDEMAEQNLLFRRQGVGTFVSKETEVGALAVFFKLKLEGKDISIIPTSRYISKIVRKPTSSEKIELKLHTSDNVVEVKRVRLIDGKEMMYEVIVVSAEIFAGLEKRELPEALYPLYHMDYKVRIVSATDKIKAISVDSAVNVALPSAKVGSPILHIHRKAYDLDQSVVEIRDTYCLTEELYYYDQIK